MSQDWPEGFAYYPDALTTAEEAELLSFIATLDLGPFVYLGNPSLRHVRNFGVDFDYDRKIAVEAPPIPAAFDTVLGRVAALTGTPRADLAELLVTRYPRGASITWHRDSRPFEAVFGVSLESDAPLKLRPANPRTREPEERPADPDGAGGAPISLCADGGGTQQVAAPCAAGEGSPRLADHPHPAAGAGNPPRSCAGAVSGPGRLAA